MAKPKKPHKAIPKMKPRKPPRKSRLLDGLARKLFSQKWRYR